MVRRRVQDRGPDAFDELGRAPRARSDESVVKAVVGELGRKPVVGHAPHGPFGGRLGNADIPRKVAHRGEMRLQSGRQLALPDRLASQRVADLVVGQRPRHDVQDAAADGGPA
jgi:hypothetical protein